MGSKINQANYSYSDNLYIPQLPTSTSGADSNKTSSVMLTVNDIIIKMNKKHQKLRHYQREYSWKEMLQSLKRYRKIHGNCNVPKGYKNQKLVRWTNLQRRQYKLFFD